MREKSEIAIQYEEDGDNHQLYNIATPLKKNAFVLSEEQKIDQITFHFKEIMEVLGLDLNDDSLKGTPYRFAKMYVKELFYGLNPIHKPSISIFENRYNYSKLLIEKDIQFSSCCKHHFLPIIGKAHIAYKSSGKIIGLSKINRIVTYYARRPQVQERLTLQIANELMEALQTKDVFVVLEAEHLCVSMRGVEDSSSKTITQHYDGIFNNENNRVELYSLLA